MQPSQTPSCSEKQQMCCTIRKSDKIFNVRKVQYKAHDNEKYLKQSQFHPLNSKNYREQPYSCTLISNIDKIGKKGVGEYNYQVAIISSTAYKELNKKYIHLKDQQSNQKQKRIAELQQKDNELNKYKIQKQRLQIEKEKLILKKQQIQNQINQIRNRNNILRAQQIQRNQEYRLMNMEFLRNMIISMRYQNGLNIDPDNMTYQQLLELEEQMGSVSKGLTVEQYQKLSLREIKNEDGEILCSICYCQVKESEWINSLPCKHSFHAECIKEWLMKQKVCPICKQEIIIKKKSQKQIKQGKQQVKSLNQSQEQ